MLKRFVRTLGAALVAASLIVPTVEAASNIDLPAPKIGKGMSVTTALEGRKSTREYSNKALTAQQLSKIFWAANGINRPETGGRVNPAAHGKYIIDVYAIMSDGIYCYDPNAHQLILVAEGDYRKTASTGQNFAVTAPLNLVYVARFDFKKPPHNAARTDSEKKASQEAVRTDSEKKVPHHAGHAFSQMNFIGVAAGAMAQSVALIIEEEGLGSCVRGSIDEENFRQAAGLKDNQRFLLAQTIGSVK